MNTPNLDNTSLLVKRNNMENNCKKWPRSKYSCIQQDEQFILQQKTFSNQYFSIYCERLNMLRASIEEQATKKWINTSQNPPRLLEKSIDIKPSQEVIIIGTLVKKIKLLPTILEQYAKERSIVPIPSNSNFFSSNDSIWLEDDSGRILLKSSEDKDDDWNNLDFNILNYSHGTVIGIKGKECEGCCIVKDICFAGVPIQPIQGPKILNNYIEPLNNKGKYIVLISNLNNASLLHKQLMYNYIEGHLGSKYEQEQNISNIIKVIIVGNSFPKIHKTKSTFGIKNKKDSETNEKLEYINKLRDLDVDLANLSSTISVDIMPSINDPTNYTIPHQAINSCLVPLASNFSNFNRVSSPHKCTIDDTIILGTTGEEIENIKQFIPIDNTLDIIEQLLEIRHIAPTTPDTLASYPSETIDPFIMNVCPHIYFVGNQKSYSSKLFTGNNGQNTQIISVPSFAETSTIVLVNINNLSCYPMEFSTDL